MNTTTLLVLIAVTTGLGAWIGYYKGRLGSGALLGLLFGVIGVIIVACLPKTEAQKIKEAADRQRIEAAAHEQLTAQPHAPEDRAMELYRRSGQGPA